MKKEFLSGLFLIPFLFLGCATNGGRSPAGADEDARVLEAFATEQLLNEIQLDQKKVQLFGKKAKAAGQEEENLKLLKEKIKKWGEDFANDTPQTIEARFQTRWRKSTEKIVFRDIRGYELLEPQKRASFVMDQTSSKSYRLEFKNYFYSDFSRDVLIQMGISPESHQKPALEFLFLCDGDFTISKSTYSMKGRGGKKLSFQLFDNGLDGEKTAFIPSENLKSCQVDFYVPEEPIKKYGFQILSEVGLSPSRVAVPPYNQLIQGCLLPRSDQVGPVEKFFLTDQFRSMSCPQAVDEVKTLPAATEALLLKLETLMGRKVSEDWLLKYTPNSELDLSDAPKFDEINISYLVFRNDFSGSLLRRLLEHHAQKGAMVRILIADVIQLEKDRKSFQLLAQKYPNFKVQEFRWKTDQFFNLKALFDSLHRDNHVKMFLTYSAEDEKLNTGIIGGRNIHDGFAFQSPVDVSKFPDLVQYPKDESYAYWQDMEYQVRDPEMVKVLHAHFMSLWEMDSETFYQRSLNLNIPTSQQVRPEYFQSEQPLVRHLMSIPYKDQQSLERFYVNMFDSAEKEIRLSTPYFNLTKPIAEAISRALARGVKMSLITRLDLKGDTIDFILSDVNKKAVNHYKDQFQIYEYTTQGVILHSKVVLVDGKLAFVGSVNLNRRSFLHDTENGMLIYSTDFYKKMTTILDRYMESSKPIQEKQKIKLMNKIILAIPLFNDAL